MLEFLGVLLDKIIEDLNSYKIDEEVRKQEERRLNSTEIVDIQVQ